MRNLKKILALVLALVMVVGMMTVASAVTPGTSYKDDASITTFDESIQILTAMGIYEGDENAAFNPNATITRAEVATLVYRVLTGDTSGKYVNIYSDYNQFADVDQNAWYAGYVNFCANAGMLKGDGTNFYPMEKVTGYQVLAIMLRVIGYGMEGEYEGTNWHIRTASKAAELEITKNITAGTLGAYSTRAMVAEMIYRSIAQAETVSYDRIWMYTGNGTTYAYTHFGLTGDISQIENSPATIDGKYDEPVSYWTWKGGTIAIRYNAKGTWNTYVNDEVLFAATGASGYYVPVNYYNEDGVAVSDDWDSKYQNYGLLNKTASYSERVFGGQGVVTELFVADGQVFVVEKNTYVDYLWIDEDTGYEYLTWTDKLYNKDGYINTGLSHGAVVIFNMFQDGTTMKAHSATVHGAKGQNVTVTHTYDKGIADGSYFVAGSTKYVYNSAYAASVNGTGTLGNRVPQVILNRDEVSLDVAVWAATNGTTLYDTFDANQTVYFDDFGNVIHTYDTPVAYTANEKGYVFVRSAAYGGQIADNRWVSTYTVITADGQPSTIKGATNPNGYWTTQVAASDADFDLGLYSYEVINGYYALYKVDTTAKSHIVANTADYATVFSAPILAGDADAIDSNVVLDDETMFIIANYDKTGMITGYSCVKGFKNIPDLTGDKYIETVWSTKDYTISLVLVLGAKQSADIVGPAKADAIVYLADTTPEDYVNTYDTHKVIVGGQSTTMQFVNNTVYNSNTGVVNYPVGFYTVKSVQFGTNYVVELNTVDTIEGSLRASGVLQVGTELVALAENCTIYQISGGAAKVITEAQLGKLAAVNVVVAATDGFGFATVVYVTDIAGR